MKIAVVGAGIFGCTIATKLSKNFEVHLYEKSNDIMGSASRTNQLRLHRGYHYPRSPETVSSLLNSINFFVDDYKPAIIEDFDHYYCIARENSRVSAENYLSFCDDFNLEYEIVDDFKFVNQEKIALTVKVKEALLNYDAVYEICKERINKSSLKLNLNTSFKKTDCEKYDLVINCTYSDINEILKSPTKDYQFEVCEKIAVQMPEAMRRKSIVVMDGPFMCVDPYGKTGNSLLGNVVHAIHSSNVGKIPQISDELSPLLNRGLINKPKLTNFSKFIETGKNYIPSLSKSVYVGSMYTVRAVLPNMDDTDGRPTVVSRQDSNIINVFSGKIDTCVNAANEILEMIGN